MQNYGFKGPGLDKVTAQADGTPLYDALQWSPGDVMQVTQNSDVQRFTGSATGNWRPFAHSKHDVKVGKLVRSVVLSVERRREEFDIGARPQRRPIGATLRDLLPIVENRDTRSLWLSHFRFRSQRSKTRAHVASAAIAL